MSKCDGSSKFNDIVWSYSNLSLFHKCKYAWRLKYIENKEKENNESFFSLYGKFCHKIMEKYAKQELMAFELPDYYCENYMSEVFIDPPYKTGDKYFSDGYTFFDTINFPGDEYTFTGIEKELRFQIESRKFISFADAIVVREQNGKEDIICIDYKTTSVKYKKNGELSKSRENLRKLTDFKHQLYMYAMGIKSETGKFPSEMWIVPIRGGDIVKFKFSLEEMKDTIKWVIDTIDKIYLERDWDVNYDEYWCSNICGYNCFQQCI